MVPRLSLDQTQQEVVSLTKVGNTDNIPWR